MDRNAITTAILLFLIFADVSKALSFWKLRYMAEESPSKKDTTAATPPGSPLPSPLSGSGSKKSDPKANSPSKLDPKLNKTDSVTPPPDDKKDPTPSEKPEKVNPPPLKELDSGNNSNSTSNSKNDKTMKDNEEKKNNTDSGKNPNNTQIEKGNETKEDKNKKETNGDETDSESGIEETCDGVANRCVVGSSLTACIKGSPEPFVLVQNSGEKTLKVNLAGPSGESFAKGLKVPKHRTRRINITLTASKSGVLVFSSGNGNCGLPLNPLVSQGNFFLNLPSYDRLVTPVNGAYFLIVTVVIFGASWACCMFRKRRRHDGIPYQELEMGLPESMAATEVETAEGWDQGWDDDWDEDKAVKSPAGCHAANISANGLTARSSNRDGWENDWDD